MKTLQVRGPARPRGVCRGVRLGVLAGLAAGWLSGCAEPREEARPALEPNELMPIGVGQVGLPLVPPESAAPAPRALNCVEVFPLVRADAAAHVVEFDGIVPLDAHNPDTPLVYLELVACTPDTREHESLVMTRAKPSHIHAALLAAGFQSGAPGLVDFRGKEIVGRPPTGDGLKIEFIYAGPDGTMKTARPEDWIIDARTRAPLSALPIGPGVWGEQGGWVFSGSRFVVRANPDGGAAREVYDADGSGVLIGLTTFGSEVIAWRQVLSPESSITAPEWITRNEAIPAYKTSVTVRISREP